MTPLSEIQTPDDLKHGLAPIWAAARLANPDFATSGLVTLSIGGSFHVAADAWRSEMFEPILLPSILAILSHARRGEAREIAACDSGLSHLLPPALSERSERAGRRLAAISSDMRGDRTLQRLVDRVNTGETPGHLATVFAVRCAVFSLNDASTVGAYLFQELCGGAASAPVAEVCDFISACLAPLPTQELRAA